jgi:hypothetical protein
LTQLCSGQRATVLQLPVTEHVRSDAAASEQRQRSPVL